jgi:hypothetical protein
MFEVRPLALVLARQIDPPHAVYARERLASAIRSLRQSKFEQRPVCSISLDDDISKDIARTQVHAKKTL